MKYILILAFSLLVSACGGGDAECRYELMGPFQPGKEPVFNPAHPEGWIEVCE